MTYALILLFSGISLSGIAVQLQLNIHVILTGIIISAFAVTWVYLILAKKQYERLSLNAGLNSVMKESTTRPAA